MITFMACSTPWLITIGRGARSRQARRLPSIVYGEECPHRRSASGDRPPPGDRVLAGQRRGSPATHPRTALRRAVAVDLEALDRPHVRLAENLVGGVPGLAQHDFIV